jgi:pimeloyl-ACP methyl ester carboxylesterase
VSVPFADLAERRVYYEEQGEGVPLLLLGDLGADHTAWSGQLEFLGRHFRVIAFDNPGSGRTAGSAGPSSTELFADVTAELLGGLTTEPVHAMGASMGGAIAQQLALRHPALVRSLVLHGTWGRADNHLTAILRSWQTAARALPRIDLCRQMWLSIFTVWHYNDRADAIAELERQVLEAPYPQSPDDFCKQADACIAHDVLDRLGEITVPTLIMVGDRDALTPPHHAYAIKERMPQARVRVWQKMGHAPFWETPDEFSAVCRDFFEEH